jgi:lysophospholipase L1-like esterase
MPNATVISPDQLNPVGNPNPYDFGASAKCLAQGDSWFSVGAVPFWSTTNLLAQLVLKEGAVVVNCAYPGRELAHMTDAVADSKFLGLLGGKMSYKWDVILLSGGGNDLIDALQVPPTTDRSLRLLLRSDEWDNTTTDVRRYLCPEGWATFESHLRIVIGAFIARRNKGQNATTPIVMHTYDYVTPRDVGAGPLGPWLFPVLSKTYGIPHVDWIGLARLLIDSLADLLQTIAQERSADKLIVVHTAGTLTPAKLDSNGTSGDWENEIHPDPHGYVLLAQKLQPVLESILFPAAPLALVAQAA